jgi:multidrug efflux system outer membrane protein
MVKPVQWILAASLATVLAGCAVGPDYHRPATPAVTDFAGREFVAPGADEGNLAWWQRFNDPLLDELVQQSLQANQDIKAADARFREARAARRSQLFDFLPTITGKASGQSLRQSRGGVPPGTPITRDYDLYEAGFDASWELDVFGRGRRYRQSVIASAQAAEAAGEGARLSVVAELARNYFELRGAQNQLAVASRNASNQQHALEVVQARMDAGRGTQLDTSRAVAQVETTLASVPPLQASVARAMHRIEVLVGAVPGSLRERLATEAVLPALPTGLGLGKPEDLLRRRPDVRVAERQLAATSARIGIATADLFPRVTINANIGLRALSFDALGDAGNDQRSFGPSISWGILDYGHIRQQIKAAGARNEAQLAAYQQTVLLALEETENALSDYGRERQRLAHLEKAAAASVQAADLATQRFEGGVADFLTALDAYRTALEAEDLLAASQTKAATALIALYKALGGGWQPQP